MTVAIEDISFDFFAFWEQAQHLPLAEQQRLWYEQYEQLHQDVFDVYYWRWGNRANLETALKRFPQRLDEMQASVARVKQLIDAAASPCAALFATDPTTLRAVVMVGVFGSDGWATWLREQPTCFCALEHVTRQRRMDVLLTHEVAHVFHGHTSAVNLDSTSIGEALFLEGVAVVASAQLIPHEAEVTYLWFGSGHTSQGQLCEDWLAECVQQWPYVRQHILQDFAQSEISDFARYFWADPSFLEVGIPVRIGYFMGSRLVSRLKQDYSMAEMVRWEPEEAVLRVQETLLQMPLLGDRAD